MAASKCPKCGRHFSGLTSFDRHQIVDYSRSDPITCTDVETDHDNWELNQYSRWSFILRDKNGTRREFPEELKVL